MPQFDSFIFSSSLFYFICCFFILLYIMFVLFLPYLTAVVKLRNKIVKGSPVENKINVSSFHKGLIGIYLSTFMY